MEAAAARRGRMVLAQTVAMDTRHGIRQHQSLVAVGAVAEVARLAAPAHTELVALVALVTEEVEAALALSQ